MDLLLNSFAFFKRYLNEGHRRSIKAKRNIITSFFIRGLGVGTSLVLVPLTIDFVNPSQYGIWLTLTSIVGWFSFFDIGFGHGLRNKFAEAVAKEDLVLAKEYVSTTYAILTIVIGIVLLVFFIANPFIDWSKILNTSPSMRNELGLLALIVFAFFCIQFVLQLISTIVTANQESAKASYFNLFGSLISLLTIYILTKTTTGDLIRLTIVLSASPVLVLATASFWLYNSEYKIFAPSFKNVRLKMAGSLINLGSRFFFIQIGAIILFETDNLVIAQLFGPAQVTPFNMAFKLFSLGTMIFMIIATPLWSAFTEAHTRGDFQWIKSVLVKMKKIWILLVFFTLLLLLFSSLIFKWWLGNNIEIPFSLSVSMSVYVIVYAWQTIHVYFLNGIGKIKLQLYLVIISGIINIPIAFVLGKKIGLAGITISNAILFLLMGITFSIQTKKILNNTAKHIWNK